MEKRAGGEGGGGLGITPPSGCAGKGVVRTLAPRTELLHGNLVRQLPLTRPPGFLHLHTPTRGLPCVL